MKGRKPRKDELALWQQVAAQTTPLSSNRAKEPEPPQVADFPDPPRSTTMIPARITPSAPLQPRPHDLAPSVNDRLGHAPLRMDRKAFQKMKRGKIVPEAKIDLHGMTLDRAHSVLGRFIMSSQAAGRRLVLVITGKGRAGPDDGPIPTRQGVLRHHVPGWLETPPLSLAVLQITQAHQSHGGGGAYYVYLRRRR